MIHELAVGRIVCKHQGRAIAYPASYTSAVAIPLPSVQAVRQAGEGSFIPTTRNCSVKGWAISGLNAVQQRLAHSLGTGAAIGSDGSGANCNGWKGFKGENK
jgi:hypothetical protein